MKEELVQSSVEEVYAEEEQLKAEEKLRKSEEKFRNIFEKASDCMIFLDVSGKILDVNRKAVEVFGGSREELLGKHFIKVGIFSIRDTPTLMSNFASILTSKQVTINITIKNKSGREIPLECSASLMKINGKVASILVIARDITERKKAEEKIKRTSEEWVKTFDAISDFVFVLDKDFRFVRVNRAICDFLKKEQKELLGKRCYEILHGTDKPLLDCPCKRMKVTKKAETTEINDPNTGLSLLATVSPLFDENGEHVGCVHIAKDITERKKMEKALRKTEEKFRTIFENVHDVITYVDKHGKILDVNNRVEVLLGYKRDEIIGKHFAKLGLIGLKDIPRMLKLFISTTRKGEAQELLELELKHKNGNKVFVEVSTRFIKENGKIKGVVNMFRDVTERKQMEETLRESEEKYRKQFEEALDAIFLGDAETGIIVDCNRAATKLVGREKSELIGKHQQILHPPKEIEGEFSRTFKQHLQEKEGQVLDTQVVTKEGEIKEVAIKANVFELRGKKLIQGIFRDITERKRAEEALRESEEKYRVLVESAADAIFTLDEAGNFLSANQEAAKAMGKTPEEMIGKNMYHLFPKDIADRQMSSIKAVFQTGNPLLANETLTQTKLGLKWYSTTLMPVRDNNGKIIYTMAISRDITERKKMEEKLRQYAEHLEELVQKRTEELLESEKRYSVLVEEASDGVVIVQDGKNIFTNKKAQEIVGYSRDELSELPPEKLFDEKSFRRVKEEYIQAIRGEIVPSPSEVELITKTGERVSVEGSPSVIHYQGRPAVLVIWRDIRERKRMEEQRLKLERLAALGELATMVGHDLRNPLQSIENAIYYLNACADDSSCSLRQKGREMFQVIDNSVHYADKIIRDLQDFSAPKAPALKETDVNTLVKETLSQVQIPRNIELRTELGYLPQIKADKDQIKRAFLNLTTNAIQAMENGGTLTVSTKQREGFVEISFKDTGTGISKENMEKIFTPFFTTRAKGMGMGLPICKKFIESHGGVIQVESEVGGGTTFTVKLPILHDNGGEKT